MKSLSESEVTYSFPKNVKFHSCLVFWANLWFYQQFHCKIYVWRWCEPNLIFFLVISKTLSFQMKKKNQIPKILPVWVFVALRHQQNFEILHLLSSLIPTKFWTKCLRCLIFAQTIVFHTYFMEITTLISIWLQLSHNGWSKLLQIFIKSISLAILSYHFF